MGERKRGGCKTLQGALYIATTALRSHPMNGHFKKEGNFLKIPMLLQKLGYK